MSWIGRIVVLGVVGYVGYGAYDLHRGGYFSLPDIPNGAYPISFKSGLRGVVHDIQVEDDTQASTPKWFRRLARANQSRRYLGVPMDVPTWASSKWAKCLPAEAEDQQEIEARMPGDYLKDLEGARLDAICFIETDQEDKPIFRGLIYSVPR